MINKLRFALIAGLALGGCTGLQQFPDASKDYQSASGELDQDYDAALTAIYGGEGPPATVGTTDSEVQKRIRNQFIEKRLAVVDLRFGQFVSALARESATAGFGVAVVEVAVGGVGSLVAESASQILSAVSGGLAGAKAAYDKTVLFEKTISALIAQMHATRKSIAAQILTRWSADLEKYPLWMAKRDLDAYEFAGSIPGAIMGTAADAKVKDDQAEVEIKRLFPEIKAEALSASAQKLREGIIEAIGGLNKEKAQALMTLIKGRFPGKKADLETAYPDTARATDPDGAKAKLVLKRAFSDFANTLEAIEKWQTALKELG